MKKNGKTLIGIGLFIGLVILCLPAAILYLLYYGYKLAFYYKDPKASPYDYEDNEQSRSCKKVWDAAITEFRSVPSERVSKLHKQCVRHAGTFSVCRKAAGKADPSR